MCDCIGLGLLFLLVIVLLPELFVASNAYKLPLCCFLAVIGIHPKHMTIHTILYIVHGNNIHKVERKMEW